MKEVKVWREEVGEGNFSRRRRKSRCAYRVRMLSIRFVFEGGTKERGGREEGRTGDAPRS